MKQLPLLLILLGLFGSCSSTLRTKEFKEVSYKQKYETNVAVFNDTVKPQLYYNGNNNVPIFSPATTRDEKK